MTPSIDPLVDSQALATVVSTQVCHADLTLNRFSYRPSVATRTVGTAAAPAYAVLMQMRAYPEAHDLWVGGTPHRVPPSPVGALSIIDLHGGAHAELKLPTDTLVLRLPSMVLDELIEGDRQVTRLSIPDAWLRVDEVLYKLAPCLAQLVDPGTTTSQLYADHLLLAAACHVVHRYGDRHCRALARGALAPWQERRAKEFMASNMARRMSLHEISSACGLSTSYFSRAFKVSAGVTPHGWLQERRVDRARDMLATSGAPLADVAAACGFADQSHLTRVFRRTVGTTPAAWRAKRRRA